MRDALIALAKEADEGFTTTGEALSNCLVGFAAIERFANLVAAKEREECAKVCDELGKQFKKPDYVATYLTCAAAIRARKP